MQDIVIGTERASIGDLIGKGGEGEVFSVRGRNGQAVKIYNTGLRVKREDKVRAMVKEGLASKTNLVSYPSELVFDRHGKFLGFLMRLVSHYHPVHELYSPKSRQRYFPEVDYRFLVRAALNCVRSIGMVHQTGCVIGDLNHSGVMVSQNATVALIDADSFQFRQNGKIYSCVVGVPDFTPPELHGENLETVVRTVGHDNFGLAVVLFHLLFMGRHPYAGQYTGPDVSMGEAIAQNRFAFSLTRQSSTRTTPPPGALTMDLFPALVGDAFEKAFGLNPSARPGASDWIKVLTKLEGSLSKCNRNRTHYYPSNTKGCVWCELARKSGFDMFPDLSAVTPNIPSDARGTEQAIREILAFRFPTAADLLPKLAPTARRGSAALREAKSGVRTRAFLGGIMIVGSVSGFFYAPSIFFIWLIMGVWGLAVVNDREIDAGPFRDAFQKADERVQHALNTLVRRDSLTEIIKVRADLDTAISDYKDMDNELAHEIKMLKSTREARHRSAYLDKFSVRHANISGIGKVKTATLISFGIETAADVDHFAVLQVPGFGDVMTGRLVDWRRRHESRFRYNPSPNDQDIAEERALRSRFASQKIKLEAIIRNGLTALNTTKPRLDSLSTKAHSDQVLSKAVEERANAEQDLKLLGAFIPKSTVALKVLPSPQRPIQSPRPARPIPTPPTRTTGMQTIPNCPRCGIPMRHRVGKYGPFWGCSRYPQCKGTRNK